MSYQAYQNAQKSAETPRQLEYRLFAQVTRALMEAKELDDVLDKRTIDALDWNRRVWSHMSTDCGTDGNGLPDELRAGIISLALFVSRHSTEIMQGKEPMDTLIDINRMIMEGLAADPSVNTEQEDAAVNQPSETPSDEGAAGANADPNKPKHADSMV